MTRMAAGVNGAWSKLGCPLFLWLVSPSGRILTKNGMGTWRAAEFRYEPDFASSGDYCLRRLILAKIPVVESFPP